MKSVKHKGLALVAVSSSMVGLGVGMAGTASALAWAQGVPGPTASLKVDPHVAGTGSSAVITVNTDSSGSTGNTNTTDFGDGASTTQSTDTHIYKTGDRKETLTETSVNTFFNISSTTQVGLAIDKSDPTKVDQTQSVPINLAANGALVTAGGTSKLDLSRILPAGADLASLSGTCDHGSGALALTIDAATKTAVCDWPAADAAGTHIVTLTYTDKATGLVSTSQESAMVPVQPVATFKAAVLSPGVVQLDVTGSTMDVGSSTGAGTVDWGDGSTSTVPLPLHNDNLQNHQYATAGTKTITFSITDRFGEHTSTSAQVDVSKASVDYAQLTRFAGATRYGTGVAASREAFPFTHSAAAVVLARGDVYADALSGIPLAKDKNGPLLLTPGGPSATTLDPNVAAEIKRVLPADKNHTVYILGGTNAIPQSVQEYVSGLGYNVERFGGPTRYETALDIAQDPQALNNPKHVVVARGDDFADALASGPFASDKFTDAAGTPAAIVLSTGNGVTEPVSLTPETAAYVTGKLGATHAAGQPDVAAIGGGAVKAVSAIAGDAASYTPISGVDRFDTAAKVAAAGWGTKPAAVGVASGMNFPDSLTGGALMALQGSPLLLSDPGATTPPLSLATGATLTADKASVKNTYLFGGTQVFGDSVAQNIIQLEGLSAAHYRILDLPF